MRKILAIIVCILLGVQGITMVPGGMEVQAEDMAQETEGSEENNSGTQDETGGTGDVQNADETEEQTEEENREARQESEESGQGEEPAGVEVSAPSAILMEASTGKIIYEKDADTRRPPASVTKIMTLLLIFDALADNRITLEDEVQTSEYAASMGGSQVFLEPGETQTVDTMIKCIAVASANDACVAMAEFVCGSEEEFVNQMNERARGLGMENTNFVNCNGLDTEGHETTARDIVIMSQELINKYPQIHDYSTIWMENITHTTKKGSSEFGLTNTNKLIRQYQYATGLKTGSTADAGFCVSATAEKNQMEMIAVIMAAKDSKARFRDATALLNYGFGKCMKYMDEGLEAIEPAKVEKGMKTEVPVKQAGSFQYIDTVGADLTQIKKKPELAKNLKAPVKEGDKVGEMVYFLNGEEIGRADIIATESVGKMKYKNALETALEKFFM